ncbi:hypothetical protein ACHAXM_001199 [Skeletonema potamos]
MNISPPAKMLTNASPPQPPQKLAELRSPQKANVQAVSISKRPEGLYFLMTPCSLRSLLSVQAYYTSFGACKYCREPPTKCARNNCEYQHKATCGLVLTLQEDKWPGKVGIL